MSWAAESTCKKTGWSTSNSRKNSLTTFRFLTTLAVSRPTSHSGSTTSGRTTSKMESEGSSNISGLGITTTQWRGSNQSWASLCSKTTILRSCLRLETTQTGCSCSQAIQCQTQAPRPCSASCSKTDSSFYLSRPTRPSGGLFSKKAPSLEKFPSFIMRTPT